MTKLVLPGMSTRKRGVILNLSSGSASLCVPLLSVYAATKSYVEHLSVCLASEYEDKNVHIQCHNPMFVSTKLAGMRNSTFFVPSPKTYAEAALANLGYETVFSPYWPHALQLWVFKCLPVRLWSKVRKHTYSQQVSLIPDLFIDVESRTALYSQTRHAKTGEESKLRDK